MRYREEDLAAVPESNWSDIYCRTRPELSGWFWMCTTNTLKSSN
jgi:hypothetical protein